MMRGAVLGIVLWSVGVAAAQPSAPPPTSVEVIVRTEIEIRDTVDAPPAKSESLGAWLPVIGLGGAAVTTVLSVPAFRDGQEPVGLNLVTTAAVAPSLGLLYAGKTRRGLGTIGARMLLGAAFYAGTVCVAETCPYGLSEDTSKRVIVGAGIGYLITVIADLAESRDAVRSYNDSHARRAVVVPTVAPSNNGTAIGLAVAGTL